MKTIKCLLVGTVLLSAGRVCSEIGNDASTDAQQQTSEFKNNTSRIVDRGDGQGCTQGPRKLMRRPPLSQRAFNDRFTVSYASYGPVGSSKGMDVTERAQKAVINEGMFIPGGEGGMNRFLGIDPNPDVRKGLIIEIKYKDYAPVLFRAEETDGFSLSLKDLELLEKKGLFSASSFSGEDGDSKKISVVHEFDIVKPDVFWGKGKDWKFPEGSLKILGAWLSERRYDYPSDYEGIRLAVMPEVYTQSIIGKCTDLFEKNGYVILPAKNSLYPVEYIIAVSYNNLPEVRFKQNAREEFLLTYEDAKDIFDGNRELLPGPVIRTRSGRKFFVARNDEIGFSTQTIVPHPEIYY
ncbi:MAG: hypothetical protein WCT20_03025, partial [Candidatus Babeliales bacterium]|jgi:hypothetical protein